MSWPPDPNEVHKHDEKAHREREVHKHDEKAHREREGQKYNTPPPPCSCGTCDDCKKRK